MSRRFLNRAFSEAQFRHKPDHRGSKNQPRSHPYPKPQSTVDPEPADVIERIIKASQEKDLFKVMGLPLPDVDALGQPVWPYDEAFITKTYRQISLLVHPDKNTGEKARQAFQLLNEAYKALLNGEKRREAVRNACAAALEEKERREACATVDEKIKINAEKIREKRKLSKIETDTFQSEILRQVKERQTAMSAKRHKITLSKFVDKTDGDGIGSDAGDEEEAEEGQKGEIEEFPDSNPMTIQERMSVSERIRTKLKKSRMTEKRTEVADDSVGDEDEWNGVLARKSKQQKRKPRFLF